MTITNKISKTIVFLACFASLFSSSVAAEVFTGVVHPQHDVELSMGEPGVVRNLSVKEGERVEEGQLLLGLQDRLQQVKAKKRRLIWRDRSELRATNKRLKILEKMLGNSRELYEQSGSISQDELYKLELRVIRAKSKKEKLKLREEREKLEYAEAERKIDRRKLRSPIPGKITNIKIEIGEWAKPGDTLLRIVDASRVFLQISVPNSIAKGLEVGSRVPIQLKGRQSPQPVEGMVEFVSPVADSASGLVKIRIGFANPEWRIRPGVKARVRLGGDSE